MILDVRMKIDKDEIVLEKFGPAAPSEMEDGYVTFRLCDYEWQEVSRIALSPLIDNRGQNVR